MRKSCLLGILIVSVCAAQTNAPTPTEIEAAEAALRGDLRGTEDVEVSQPHGPLIPGRLPIEIQPPESLADRPSRRSVSVAQLRHKPPKNTQQSVARGAKLSQAGYHRRAAEEFEKAIARDPQFANAHDRLGVEYAQLGRYREAEAEVRRSIALAPVSWTAHYDLGVLLFQMGDYAGAEQSARRALELGKNNAQIHLFLGLLLAGRVETRADAVEHLRYAARTMPQANELLKNLQQK
jgi:tetratricopeptide (TPR) repeat protein